MKYSKKVVENVKASEDRTSKKRAKRSKKKQKQKGKKPKMDEKGTLPSFSDNIEKLEILYNYVNAS